MRDNIWCHEMINNAVSSSSVMENCPQIKSVYHYAFMTSIDWLFFLFKKLFPLCRNSLEDGDQNAHFHWNKHLLEQHGEACVASEELHSSSEQILITDSGGGERRKPVDRYLMDEMLSSSMIDSPSLRQTIQKTLARGNRTLEVANRGVKFEEGIITIYIPSWECFKMVRTNSRLDFYQ